jgi:serine/threonine protein kinase
VWCGVDPPFLVRGRRWISLRKRNLWGACSLLLDDKGYCKLVDFGFAKQLVTDEKAYTLCGTPEYLVRETYRDRN